MSYFTNPAISPFQRVCNLMVSCMHYARWSWRLGHFSFRSRLLGPDTIAGGRSIRIGRRVIVGKGARLESFKGGLIEIGENTSIQMYFHCGAASSVKIGRDVLIASRVYISDHDHRIDHPEYPPRHTDDLIIKPVVVGDGAWLGEGCVILKGVTIGARAVVGANAVVTRDVPPLGVVGGVPARLIRMIEL
jgi:lipopolysaccharide O-acetyltransferase